MEEGPWIIRRTLAWAMTQRACGVSTAGATLPGTILSPPAPASPGPAPSALAPNNPALKPSTPPQQHTHINPYQIQQLNSSWVFKGSSFTSYFEESGRGAEAPAGAAGWGAAVASFLLASLPGSPCLR